MGKTLQLLAFVGLILLIIGTAFLSQNPAFWLASPDSLYQQLRLALALILMLQLATRPPRYLWFRIVTGVVAIGVGGWAIEATYAYHMLFFDTLCFLGAAIAIAAASLESQPHTSDVMQSNKKVLA